jgi:hypothetical protein
MKKLILISSIFALLLLGVWGCPDQTEQSKKASIGAGESVENKASETGEPAKAGTGNSAEIAMEKTKDVVEELQVTTQGSMEETKAAE